MFGAVESMSTVMYTAFLFPFVMLFWDKVSRRIRKK